MESVLLIGDSLIEWGDWETLLPGCGTINRGIAGETAKDLAGRLGDEVNRIDDPDWIVVLSGTNDLLMGDSFFPAVFETMLPLLRRLCPGSRIMVIGLAPMRMVLRAVEEANEWLEKTAFAAGCSYLDLTEPFALHCRPAGNPCFMMDGVHFTSHGYKVLAGAVKSMLEL